SCPEYRHLHSVPWVDPNEIVAAHEGNQKFDEPDIKHRWHAYYSWAVEVRDILTQHGETVAAWLDKERLPGWEALTWFLHFPTPEYAKRSIDVLALARTRVASARKDPAAPRKEVPPDPETPLSLRRTGEMWSIRYHDEACNFSVKGNQFIGWLAKLV